jgi:uncharacterized protein (DUF1786 family)
MGMVIDPVRILAVDVGAGTQDILVYDSRMSIENCAKLVMPSQTQVIARALRQATQRQVPIHLTGHVMGGGASSDAVLEHLHAGLRVTASSSAARTLHNDLDRVERMGIRITEEPIPGSEVIWLCDIDLDALRSLLDRFAVSMPPIFAIAVQDHGYLPGEGGREFRYEYLQSLLSGGGDILDMVYRQPAEYMIRMRAITSALPGALVMDTGAAAVLGALGDPLVAQQARSSGAVIVNIGNMHTFGIALRGRKVHGLFEHHTGGITPDVLGRLVARLQAGVLTHEEVVENGGHGAAFGPQYRESEPFGFVAITGPNRHIARSLNYHEAVPHGDMMLAGPFGLVEATLQRLTAEGYDLAVKTIMGH